MTTSQVRRLKSGDLVRWHDHAAEMGDEFDCSHDIVVVSVRVNDEGGDGIVVVTGADGESLECFVHELTRCR